MQCLMKVRMIYGFNTDLAIDFTDWNIYSGSNVVIAWSISVNKKRKGAKMELNELTDKELKMKMIEAQEDVNRWKGASDGSDGAAYEVLWNIQKEVIRRWTSQVQI